MAGAKELVDQAVETFGQLDILVNNAGILRDKMSFNMEESDWDDVIRVHLKGHFAPSHHAAVYWRNRAKAGETVSAHIINTSSEAGLYGNAGQANYSSAKAGIASLTWVLARELERYGVTVNAISPRARTRMTENLFGEMTKAAEGFDEWDPRNIAQLVAFLSSDEASDVTGQNFVVFGGNVGPWAGSTRSASCTGTPCGRRRSWPEPRASCSKGCPRAFRSSASSRGRTADHRPRPGAARPGQLRLGTTAVASPTTFSSPSALRRRTSMSTRWSAPSVRLPVTTILVCQLLVRPGLLGEPA